MKILGDTNVELMTGDPTRLGVSPVGKHMNFAVAVPGAEEVLLHLCKEGEATPAFTVVMEAGERLGDVFAVQLKNFSGKGMTYRYEVKGCPFADPYAKSLLGRDTYGKVLTKRERKAFCSPVVPAAFDWKGDCHPDVAFADLVLYKLHVRGFSMQSGVAHKGTYKGIVEKLPYLKQLGINGVLLMPCMEFNEIIEKDAEEGVPEFVSSKFYKSSAYESVEGMTENPARQSKKQINFWGYAAHYFFFAPKASYASVPAKADAEFKEMVRRLHQEGIEVLMEVNVPAGANPGMVVDALRYWVMEYHVDGFRINQDMIDLRVLAADPYLAKTKLLTGNWNGAGDKVVGGRGAYLADCNEGFLLDCRRFLKSDEGLAGSFARRVKENRENIGTVNYITDHNGFTLADLYMYDVKHNEANGENGRDGSDYNCSWNCGTEGPDKRKKVRDLRLKMKKNALMTLLLSQGTPILLAGDEFGNSQGGNNNAYCQDNSTGWLNWKEQRSNAEITEFVKELVALRKAHPALHNPHGLRGSDYLQCGCPDVSCHSTKIWYPDESNYNRCVGVLLSGEFAKDKSGKADASFYLIFNMYWEEREFDIPHLPGYGEWKLAISSDKTCGAPAAEDSVLMIPPRTIAVLMCEKQEMPVSAPKRRRKPVATPKEANA